MTAQASAGPQLEGNLVPAFDLARAGGGAVRLRAYRGRRSVALFFLHAPDCAPCRDIAAAILPHYGDYAFADAEPLVIIPGSVSSAEQLRDALALPFPVLADPEAATARRYGVTAGGVALLIADRFGAPALWCAANEGHALPGQEAVLRELAYLSHTCSGGCATPIWPPEPESAP